MRIEQSDVISVQRLVQFAPYPDELAALLGRLTYKPGWHFELRDLNRGQGSTGLTLDITITTLDSYDITETRRVSHYFPVPPAAYDQRSWRRWLFEQILLVETHEAMEFFTLDLGEGFIKPYAPSHGPGNDPYLIRELGTELDQRTAYTGAVQS